MMLHNRGRTTGFSLVVTIGIAVLASSAQGQNSWVGTNNAFWNDAGNWSVGLPANSLANGHVEFVQSGATNFSAISWNGGANTSIRSMMFNSDAASGVMISGLASSANRLTFTNTTASSVNVSGLFDLTANPDDLNVRIRVAQGNHVISGAKAGGSNYDVGLSAPGSGNPDAIHIWEVAAGASLTFDATLGRVGSGNLDIRKSGDGTVVLNGSSAMNQYSLAVNSGVLVFGAAGVRGGSTPVTVSSGATLQMNNMNYAGNNSTLTLNGNGFNGMGALRATDGLDNVVPGTASPSAENMGAAIGKVIIATDSSIAVDAGSKLKWTHGIDSSGTGNLTKTGAGTFVFEANNSLPQYGYSGTITVAEGTFLLDSQAVTSVVVGSIDPSGAPTNNRFITLTSNAGIKIGQEVSGPGISAGKFLTSVNLTNTNVTVNEFLLTATTNENYTFLGIASALNNSPVVVQSGATFGGVGSILGSSVTVDAGGTLAPGSSIGELTVGSADLAGTLEIEFNGSTIDKLKVAGALDITGATLTFTDLGTLTGTAHVFAEYDSLTGNPFATVNGLPSGYTINYNYENNHQIALVSSLVAGDFNGDGDVDGDDFGVWQSNFPTASGAMLTDGDADGDGDVDGADFVVWQTNFPFMPAAEASPVPEPQAWLLCLLGTLLALSWLGKSREQAVGI